MDTIFKRYSCPFVLLDNLILTSSLCDFIGDLYNFILEESKEKVEWEYFLHKVFDMNFKEYLEKVEKSNNVYDDVNLNATVEKSIDILQNFTPESEV